MRMVPYWFGVDELLRLPVGPSALRKSGFLIQFFATLEWDKHSLAQGVLANSLPLTQQPQFRDLQMVNKKLVETHQSIEVSPGEVKF